MPNAPLLTGFSISDERILNVIRSLNPNSVSRSKAHGWDDDSVRMIKIRDAALLEPLRLIFECVCTRVFSLKSGNELT